MYYAVDVFAAVYEYMCPFTSLSRSCISHSHPLLYFLLSLFSTCFTTTPTLADRQTNSFFWSRVVSWCCFFSQLTAWVHTHTQAHRRTQHKHAHTGPTPDTPRGAWLTKIKNHQSRPLWNGSGESQVNITACKGQTGRHRWSSCLYTHLSILSCLNECVGSLDNVE